MDGEVFAFASHPQQDLGSWSAARPDFAPQGGEVGDFIRADAEDAIAGLEPGLGGGATIGEAADHETPFAIHRVHPEPGPWRVDPPGGE